MDYVKDSLSKCNSVECSYCYDDLDGSGEKSDDVDHSWARGPFGMQCIEEAFKRDVENGDRLPTKR